MKEQEEQGCFKPLMIGIIITVILIVIVSLFIPHHNIRTYEYEDVIMVEEPVLKIDNQGRYYISTKRSYYLSNQKKKAKNS